MTIGEAYILVATVLIFTWPWWGHVNNTTERE